MKPFTSVVIVGNVGAAPKVEFLPSGTCVGSFSVAVNERWKKDEEWKEKTHWIPVKAWGKVIEIPTDNGLTKGSPVVVVGTLEEETWESNGKKYSKIVVKATGIDIIVRPPKDE